MLNFDEDLIPTAAPASVHMAPMGIGAAMNNDTSEHAYTIASTSTGASGWKTSASSTAALT